MASIPANIQTSWSTEVSDIKRRLTAVIFNNNIIMGNIRGIDKTDIRVLPDCSELAIKETKVSIIAIPVRPREEPIKNNVGSLTGKPRNNDINIKMDIKSNPRNKML